MKKKTTKGRGRSRRKSVKLEGRVDQVDQDKGIAQLSLPIAEILAGVSDADERVAGEAGLLIMKALLDEEVEGPWPGSATSTRTTVRRTAGDGRRVTLSLPERRSPSRGRECGVETAKKFPSNG